MELPRLEKGVLHIGGSQLILQNCDLDTLIEAFGDPEEYFYFMSDERFLIFKFLHELGDLFAFVLFRQPLTPVVLGTEWYVPGLDRGILAELHIELNESIAISKLGKVKKKLANGQFRFVLFSRRFLGRVFKLSEVDAISFINRGVIKSVKGSFMYNLFFWLDSKPSLSYLRETERQEEKEYKFAVLEDLIQEVSDN